MATTEAPPAHLPPPIAFDENTMATVRAARERLERDPWDADALIVVAIWYSMLGELPTALRFLQRLTRARPGYPGVWRLKAGVYRQLGKEDMAKRCEETARTYEGPEDEGDTGD